MNPGERRADPFRAPSGETLYRVVECVGVHEGAAMTITWEGLYRSRAAAETAAGIDPKRYQCPDCGADGAVYTIHGDTWRYACTRNGSHRSWGVTNGQRD